MTLPQVPVERPAADRGAPATASVCALGVRPLAVATLTQRADFLRAARASSAKMPGLFVQARRRRAGEANGVRVGYTCSRKVGNAVARNRAKRRLRAAAQAVLPTKGQDGWDYVLIGRAGRTASRPFDFLLSDLDAALSLLHSQGA